MLDEIKTTSEAAKIIGKTQEHVAYLCRHGVFAGATKKGKTWLIPYTSLIIYMIDHGNKKKQQEYVTDTAEEA